MSARPSRWNRSMIYGWRLLHGPQTRPRHRGHLSGLGHRKSRPSLKSCLTVSSTKITKEVGLRGFISLLSLGQGCFTTLAPSFPRNRKAHLMRTLLLIDNLITDPFRSSNYEKYPLPPTHSAISRHTKIIGNRIEVDCAMRGQLIKLNHNSR